VRLAIHIDGKSIRGNEVQSLLIARTMKEKGHAVVVACRKNGEVEARAREEGIEVAGVVPRGDGDFISALLFANWLKQGHFDVVLFTSWKKSFMASWAARVARIPRVVLRVGGPHTIHSGARGWKYRRALLRQVDSIICNSPGIAAALRNQMPELPGDHVSVIMNGLDERDVETAVSRASHGVPDHAMHCVAVGGLDPGKGFDLLLDAVAKANLPDLHLSIAGAGPEYNSLRELAERLGISQTVHLLGHRSDVREILAEADVFVLSTRSDSIPVALLEAMASGPSIVATDVPGVEEALSAREGRVAAGWIVPVGDVSALAATLRDVASMHRGGDSTIHIKRTEAQWRITNWFSAGKMSDSVERVLLATEEP